MADLNTVFQRSESLVTRDLVGEKVIVPVRAKVGDLNSIYTLNPTANDVWALLDGQHSVADILQKLEHEYEVDSSTLASDVTNLLQDLSSEGLIRAISN